MYKLSFSLQISQFAVALLDRISKPASNLWVKVGLIIQWITDFNKGYSPCGGLNFNSVKNKCTFRMICRNTTHQFTINNSYWLMKARN